MDFDTDSEHMERRLRDAGYYVARDGADHFRLYRTTTHRAWREAGQPQWWLTLLEALRYGYRRFVRNA